MPIAIERTSPAPVSELAQQFMVPMRDGVELATDVYAPAEPGRRPAVLTRLPYDKNSAYVFMAVIAPHLARNGYVLVVQDVRGKFRSQGETMPFVHETHDGYDTIEWITRQPWSNGVVGMFGDSYFGFTQWAAAASEHPALRAIAPRFTSKDLDVIVPRWDPHSVVPLYGADYLADYWSIPDVVHHAIDHARRPLLAAYREAFAQAGTSSLAFDACVPSPAQVERYPHGHPIAARPVPTLHGVGWFDNLLLESMRDYTEMAAHPAWGPVTYLYADSSDHECYYLDHAPHTAANDHQQSDQARERLIARTLEPILEFFEVFLKAERDAAQLPRVRWHLGHVGLQTSESWPPPNTGEIQLHLGAAEKAAHDAQGGTLSAQPDHAPGQAEWTHDPDDLVPSIAGDPFSALREWTDQSVLHSRHDVLTFTTEPASEPLDLAGPVHATITAASTAPNMHLVAKLYDISPNGAARMLLRGQDVIPPAVGDEAASVPVDLGHTGYRLRPGHRLRLQLTCSDFPEYLWHPGTGENPWLATVGKTSAQTLHTGGASTSHLSLTALAAPQRDT